MLLQLCLKGQLSIPAGMDSGPEWYRYLENLSSTPASEEGGPVFIDHISVDKTKIALGKAINKDQPFLANK